jgi:hypothetical protein
MLYHLPETSLHNLKSSNINEMAARPYEFTFKRIFQALKAE